MIDAIIDISHYQSPTDFGAAKAAGLLGVICKASQGLTYTDPALIPHRTVARNAGLLTGCYHFGTGGDGAGQAAWFLEHVTSGDLMALDFEPNPGGADMSLSDAVDFVVAIQAQTGKTPVLYGGSSLKGVTVPPELTACPLWLAQYGPTAVLPAGWASWSLWQYSDGAINAPAAEWPGIGACDRDRWCGAPEQLPDFWAEYGL